MLCFSPREGASRRCAVKKRLQLGDFHLAFRIREAISRGCDLAD
jgi:hypothetical protein